PRMAQFASWSRKPTALPAAPAASGVMWEAAFGAPTEATVRAIGRPSAAATTGSLVQLSSAGLACRDGGVPPRADVARAQVIAVHHVKRCAAAGLRDANAQVAGIFTAV